MAIKCVLGGMLCDNISDQPSGCDACWLYEDGNCAKEILYERMKAESEEYRMKTYGDIYSEFCNKFPNVEVEDYRPADPMYIPQLLRGIPYAILVWLKDGSKVIYMSDKESD